MNSTSKLVLVALGGVAIGAAAGILFAPKSGKETREDLANKIAELKEKITEALEKGSDITSDSIDEMKEKLSALEQKINSKKQKA